MEMYRQGGNIVDAVVATGFAMSVERPHSLGLGGGGFLTLYVAGAQPKSFFFDFRETAPHRATRDMYLDAQGKVIPNRSVLGPLAVATPGLVAGFFEIHRKHGKLPWKTVLGPAIRLARDGFPVYPSLAERIAARTAEFGKDAGFKKVFLNADGTPLKTGDRLVQADLAKSLEAIAAGGADVFYRGAIAKKIVDYLKKEKGLLDASDLKSYKMVERAPIPGHFGDVTLVTSPPPSAGGVALVEMLNALAGDELQTMPASRYTSLLTEVMKRAYADRSYFIGDPDFVRKPYEKLLTPGYAARLRKSVDPAHATPSEKIRPAVDFPEDHGTSHLSIIDSEGNGAASTLTINGTFGAMMMVPGTGIILNNEMDDFSAKPGEQNIYGLTGGEANAIAPGKRPVSSMTPTIVVKDDKAILAVGGAGGSRIISSVTNVILNYIARYPGDLRRAVFQPRAHHQWIPDQLDLEEGFPSATRDYLSAAGNKLTPWPWTAQVQAAGRDAAGNLVAVFDPRDAGGAVAE
jgi:gamma-glutamyltranspeptidase/glutathione hydrolase